MLQRALVASVILFVVQSAAAQSFDCARAQTRVEKMVCGEQAVADLDEYLGRYYAMARAAMPAAGSCLQADQSQWLKTRRDTCADVSCLKTAYLERLAELDSLQPGVTALQNVALPDVASLVWIIPPASDKVAAPPNPKATPFEATGAIVNDIASNPKSEGIVLRTQDGTRIPLMLMMFLEGDSQDRLTGLSKEKGATFRARGYAGANSGGRYFEPSRCTFVHRMPAAQAAPAEQEPEQQLEKVRTRVITQGKVCADPDKPCSGFKPNELSFDIAKPFAFDRGRDKSQPFYAVILMSGPLCGIADRERVRAQQLFPRAKVFLHRHMCEDFGDRVTYSNVNAKSGFVAVYSGETEADAQQILAQARAAGYPGANVRRMEVIVTYQIE